MHTEQISTNINNTESDLFGKIHTSLTQAKSRVSQLLKFLLDLFFLLKMNAFLRTRLKR